ncbi:MAG: site-specific integrase, partial [Oscillospiraceae bacterium]|nr:site-specific integrase [Oscillospiraceae bacterium]
MENCTITAGRLENFAVYLRKQERAEGTVGKYLHDVRAFAAWLDGKSVNKEVVAEWKDHLCERGYAPVTVNSMLAALHSFFDFAEISGCKVKYLKIQRRVFRDPVRELGRGEYERLVAAAREMGKARLALLMETIAATGIRVSEVKYITVAAAQKGRAEIALKGKIRTILLPNKLARKLLKYAKKQKIAS